jgi:hypothetical protein
MSVLNTDSLVQELRKRHEIYLKPNDPIFAMLTMNELLLANYQEQFKASIEQNVTDHDTLVVQRINKHLELSLKQANTVIEAMNESFTQHGAEVKAAIQATVKTELAQIKEASDNGVRKMNKMSQTISVLTGVATTVTGIFIGMLIKTLW